MDGRDPRASGCTVAIYHRSVDYRFVGTQSGRTTATHSATNSVESKGSSVLESTIFSSIRSIPARAKRGCNGAR
jgi:hypothetical protein